MGARVLFVIGLVNVCVGFIGEHLDLVIFGTGMALAAELRWAAESIVAELRRPRL